MRRSFPRFLAVVALLIATFAQSQTADSIFLRGQLEINGGIASLTVDSDHSKVAITNPEVVRAEKNREVLLHAISAKDGIRVISSASIDNQNKPDDFSFAAIVSERKDAQMVERLLQIGANPNAKTQDGIPALVAAMHMGDQTLMPVTGFDPSIEITTLLLDHGANPLEPALVALPEDVRLRMDRNSTSSASLVPMLSFPCRPLHSHSGHQFVDGVIFLISAISCRDLHGP